MDKTISSYWITEQVLRYSVGAFAVFTVALHLAFYFHLSFSLITSINVTVLTICGFFFTKSLYKKRGLFSKSSKSISIFLIVLAIISGLVTSSINSPEEDDSLYAPFALQSVNKANEPMSFSMDWIIPFQSGEKFTAKLASLSNGIPYFWGTVTYILNINYLVAYTVLGSFLFGAAFPLIYFYIISLFVPEEKAALLGTLALSIVVYLIFRENGNGYGTELNKIWIGKVVLRALLIPLAMGFSFKFLKNPTIVNWSFVALSGIASTGLSSSALFLFPMLLMTIAAGNFVGMAIARERDIATQLKNSITLGIAGFYPAAASIYFYFFSSETTSIQKHADVIGGHGDFFLGAYQVFFAHPLSLTSLCVMGAALYLIIQRIISCSVLIGSFIASIVLFANPYTSNFVAQYMTSTVAYSRVFFLIPVFAIFGVAVSALMFPSPNLVADGTTSRKSNGRAILLMTAFGASVLFLMIRIAYDNKQFIADKLSLYSPHKQYLLGVPEVSYPAPKLDEGLINDINHFVEILPSGATLASIDYAIAVPMVTMKFPQFYLWPPPVIRVYGETQGRVEDAVTREKAGEFLNGNPRFQQEFGSLLALGVKNVIASKRINRDLSRLNAEALDKGFVLLETTDRYALYTRP